MNPQKITEILSQPGMTSEIARDEINDYLGQLANEDMSKYDLNSPNGRAAISFNLYLRQISATKIVAEWWEANVKDSQDPQTQTLWKDYNLRRDSQLVQTLLRAIYEELDGFEKDYSFHPGFQFLAERPMFRAKLDGVEMKQEWAGGLTFRELKKWITKTAAPILDTNTTEYLQACQSSKRSLMERIAIAAGATIDKDGRVIDAKGEDVLVDAAGLDQMGMGVHDENADQASYDEPTETASFERLPRKDEFDFVLNGQLSIILATGMEKLARTASGDPIGYWRDQNHPPIASAIDAYYGEKRGDGEKQNTLARRFLISRLIQKRAGQNLLADFIIRSKITEDCSEGRVVDDIRSQISRLGKGRLHVNQWCLQLIHYAQNELGIESDLINKLNASAELDPQAKKEIDECVNWIEEQCATIGSAAEEGMTLDDLQASSPNAHEIFRIIERRYTASEQTAKESLAKLGLNSTQNFYIGPRSSAERACNFIKSKVSAKILQALTEDNSWHTEARERANALLAQTKEVKENTQLTEVERVEKNKAIQAKKAELRDWLYERVKGTLQKQFDLLSRDNKKRDNKDINKDILADTNRVLDGGVSKTRVYTGGDLDYDQAAWAYWPSVAARDFPHIAKELPKEIPDEHAWEQLKANASPALKAVMEKQPHETELPSKLKEVLAKRFWHGVGERIAMDHQKLFLDKVEKDLKSKEPACTINEDGTIRVDYVAIALELAKETKHLYLAGVINGALETANRILQNPKASWEFNTYRRNLKANERDARLAYVVRKDEEGQLAMDIVRVHKRGTQQIRTTQTYTRKDWKRSKEILAR